MELPDYTTGAAFLGVLSQGHHGQHRCTDGVYYRPTTPCPVMGLTDAVLTVLDHAQQAPHNSCHDPAAVETVAQAMCQHPDGDPVLLDSLDPPQRAWWVSRAQLAMEAHAALLDPTLART